MDELLSQCSSSFLPSPSSMFSPVGHQVLEFTSCEVPEQWLLGDLVVAKNDHGELWPVERSLSQDSEFSNLPPNLPEPDSTKRPEKRRGRKPRPRPDGPTISHVEAERQRRDKLNRRFCDLRAAVPTVSRMDKASLLADAADYIAELRTRVARLEGEGRTEATARWEPSSTGAASRGVSAGATSLADEAVEVRMMGPEAAAVRVTSAARHAPALLMGALRSLELQVQHACVTRVRGVTVQDVVVDVPAALQDGDGLRSALLQRLQLDSA